MIANLQDLIAPLGETEFSSLLNDRQLKLLRRPDDRRFAEMYDWTRLRALIDADQFKSKHLRVTWKEKPVEHVFFRRNGKVDPDLMNAVLARGASVLANRIEKYVPEIGALCASLAAKTKEHVCAASVVSTGTGGALPLHYDKVDNIVVQVDGTKRWRIYDAPVMYPVSDMQARPAPEGTPLLDVTLEPGDLLFVPAGYWHHCDNGPEVSHHVGFLLMPPTGRDAFLPLLNELAEEELFRVPLTRIPEAEQAGHEAALRARLIERIQNIPVEPATALASMRQRQSAMKTDDH